MKPSDRINEILHSLLDDKIFPLEKTEAIIAHINAVIIYLDEEHEKKCEHIWAFMSEDGIPVEKCIYCGERRYKA